MNKLKILKSIFILPLLLIIIGGLFLYLVAHWVFELLPWAGYSIAVAIILFSGILIALNRNLILKIQKSEKPRGRVTIPHHTVAFLMIIAIGFMGYINILTLDSFHYNTGPVLTWNSDQDPKTEITLMWRTRSPTNSIVFYGTESGNLYLNNSDNNSVEWHIVSLSGLAPNTKYFYRIGDKPTSKEYSFTTAPISENNFTFLLFADPRQNDGQFTYGFRPNIAKHMMQKMQAQGIQPAFTLCAGDITGEAKNWVTWKSWFDDLSKTGLGSSATVQIAIGNHERHGNADGTEFAKFYPYTYHPYYYYSFNYSSVHVSVLDPWNETSGWWGNFESTQLEWLEQDLINAQSMKYRIISMHPAPIYKNQINYQPLFDLCDKYGVAAVFFGHEHEFAYTKINNTMYYLIGVGGNNYANPTGFVQVDVSSELMSIGIHWDNATYQPLSIISA